MRQPGEPAIEGRPTIAQALSGIMGVPVSVYQLDRWEVDERHPVPIHRHRGKKCPWAFVSELQIWWQEEEEEQ